MVYEVELLALGASEPEITEVEAEDVAQVLTQLAPNFEGYDALVRLKIEPS